MKPPRPFRVPLPFALLSAAFAFTAVFHLAAAIDGSIDPEAPAWRHLLFVGINLGCIAGFVWRPRAFLLLFPILLVQQVATHGWHIWTMWRDTRAIDFPSIAVVIVMPLALWLLVRDARPRAAASRR